MKKILMIFGFLSFVISFHIEAQTIEIFASPDGIGTKGTLKFPCSLEEAVKKAGNLTQTTSGDIIVTLRGGTYNLTKTVEFDNEYSGSNSNSVTFKAYSNEIPIISGGKSIQGWEYHENGIYKAKVDKSFQFRQLYCNGKRLTRARTPNTGKENKILFWDAATKEIAIDLMEINNWKNFEKVEMYAYIQWSDAVMRLKSFSANVKSDKWIPGNYARIQVQEPEQSFIFNRVHPNRVSGQAYHFENAYEFIDETGEWYLDSEQGVLYLKPYSSTDLNTTEIIAPSLETLVKLHGTPENPIHNVVFSGITFQHTNWTYPNEAGHTPLQGGQYLPRPKSDKYSGHPVAGVHVKNARNIRFELCQFSHLGSAGLDFHTGVSECVITGSVFQDISGNGISIGEYFDPNVLEKGFYKDERDACKNNVISNNIITKVGQDYAGSIAVSCGYVEGVDILHNEIFDVPYLGISVGWGWSKNENAMRNNKIRHNELYRVMQRTEDGGAIYTLSKQPGSEIYGNYIHDITPWQYIEREIIRGIYLDEGSGGITVGNNAIIKGDIHKPGYHMTEEIGFHMVDGITINNNCCQAYKKEIKDTAGLMPEFKNIRFLVD